MAAGKERRKGDAPGLTRAQKLELYNDMRLTGSPEERLVNFNRQTMDAPVLRVTAADVPLPYSPPLEDYVLPQTSDK